MPKCSQCDKPAIVNYDDVNLCVEHHLMMQQATYLRVSMLAANLNFLQEKISTGTGGIIPPSRIELPKPPFFVGDNFTLNNISVTGSTIGMINTGTLQNIQNLDNSITLARGRGEEEIAAVVKELTQAILESKRVTESAKKEILEQLDILMSQLTAEPRGRSIGVVKSLLSGVRPFVAVAADLLTIWDKLEPLFRSSFGI